MFCPFCETGDVEKAKIAKLNKIIYVCNECDASWLDTDIRRDNCIDLDDLLESYGIPIEEPFSETFSDVTKDWDR